MGMLIAGGLPIKVIILFEKCKLRYYLAKDLLKKDGIDLEKEYVKFFNDIDGKRSGDEN